MTANEIQDQINNIDAQIQAGAPQGQIDRLNDQKTELETQLAAALADEATQQRVQAQEQQIGGLKETLRTIFEAAFPKDETVKLIGLTEYETTQQTFNQLVDQAVDENQTGLYAAFDEQLAAKDEKIRALNVQGLEVQNQLDQADDLLHTTIKSLHELEQQASSHTQEIADRDATIEQQKGHIEDLRVQIANAPAPKAAIEMGSIIPSTSLSDQIAQAKVASIKKFSNLYSDVTYSDGTKQVVHNSQIANLEIPVLPNLTPMDTQTVEQSTNPAPVTQEDFRNGDPATTGGDVVQSGEIVADSNHGEVPETADRRKDSISREEFEALVARVAEIEGHIPAVA